MLYYSARRFLAISLMALPAIATPAQAQEGPAPADITPEDEFCFPAKDITKQINKMEDLKDSKRDTVRVFFEANIGVPEGQPYPERLEVRDADQITPIKVDLVSGRTLNMQDTLRTASEDAQMCIIDPYREQRGEEKMSFGVSMRVGFIETPGTHSLAQIEDGLKDGRSHYKKMAGAMGFMVPKFGHIALASDDKDNPPRAFITRAGADIGEPEFEIYDGARLIDVDQIEAMGGDGLRVDGPYRMSPSPDAKTIAKFSGGGDTDDNEDEEKGRE